MGERGVKQGMPECYWLTVSARTVPAQNRYEEASAGVLIRLFQTTFLGLPVLASAAPELSASDAEGSWYSSPYPYPYPYPYP